MNAASDDGPYGKIGEGGFGTVFKGLAVPPVGAAIGTSAVRLAVKRIDMHPAEENENVFLQSFRREIRVLSKFQHTNIVRLMGYSERSAERNEPPCLVFELLNLGSLSKQLSDNDKAALIPWQTRIDILLQISTAINYLHCHEDGHPAFHRDIKSANIALSDNYTAKLIDCGYYCETLFFSRML